MRTAHIFSGLQKLAMAWAFIGGLSFLQELQAEQATSHGTPSQVGTNPIENSVVKVFSKIRPPDLYQPWTKQQSTDVTGSGVVIEGKRILSNAHVVLYASQVQVQANHAGDKLSATVVAVAPGIDLAILKLDDETFFETHPPLVRASTLPKIKDAVMAYGYPEGGDSLSITKGIVSRIEFARYNYPLYGLRIQIDAAINPGNSGGPAVAGDKMIGLAFSTLGGAQNIGYIIPCEEIELFLQSITNGGYTGKPAMYDELQTLENPTLRKFLKLPDSAKGVVVNKPYGTVEAYPLKKWDLITKIGDIPVDDQGMIEFGSDLRISFQYMVQKIAKEGKVPLTIVRESNEMRVSLPVTRKKVEVIPSLEGTYPSYFVLGPVVFSSATLEFVAGLTREQDGGEWRSWFRDNKSPLMTRLYDKPACEGEGLVVVASRFFPHKLAQGYSDPFAAVVKTVNGTPIRNLAHLVEVLRDSKDQYITLEFDARTSETLVFPRAAMLAATDEILTDNGVRSQASPDLLAVWTSKH